MAKFYKATNRAHPKHELPAVLWNPAADRPVFEFFRGPSGFLECETNDSDTIKLLQKMGYDQEPEDSLSAAPPPLKGVHVHSSGKIPSKVTQQEA